MEENQNNRQKEPETTNAENINEQEKINMKSAEKPQNKEEDGFYNWSEHKRKRLENWYEGK